MKGKARRMLALSLVMIMVLCSLAISPVLSVTAAGELGAPLNFVIMDCNPVFEGLASNTWGNVVGKLDPNENGPQSAVTFTVNVPEAGRYKLSVHHVTNWGSASHSYQINDNDPITFNYPTGDWMDSEFPEDIQLNKGANTIRIAYVSGVTELRWVDLQQYIDVPDLDLESISVTNPPIKQSYYLGESLNLTGLVVTGEYSDGSSKTIPVTMANISGFSSSTVNPSLILTVTVEDKTANFTVEIKEGTPPVSKTVSANPYLPLWEHVPDGETRVFDDPDNPGKQRAYIIGSHDQRNAAYCGPDIVMWSAPTDDLTNWRNEGPIYTFRHPTSGNWANMYAPDLVEVKRFAPEIESGQRERTPQDERTITEYYLYPHPNSVIGKGITCKSITGRPEGPYEPVNLNAAGTGLLSGSVIGFDPSVLVDYVDDPEDPDYNIGFRAYAYWGWEQSTAAELNQSTMYSVRPLGEGESAEDYPGRGTQYDYFIPVSQSYGNIRANSQANSDRWRITDPERAGEYNYFEAFAIRKVEVPDGNDKYLVIFSGYSGPDYGMGSTNSAMRYLYGDSPMGPWTMGGVIVDSRGPVPNENGTALVGGAWAHNTHGGPWYMNGQWYIAYHRPPRGGGGNRQAMVAPIKIDLSQAKPKVADGGKLTIRAYDPYAEDETWTARGGDNEYTGAEVTSEGFNVYGLPPYQYYSAGIACDLQGGNANRSIQDSWDIWDNHMPLDGLQNGSRIGYKYFGFGGLEEDSKGLPAFEGTKPGNNTKFNLWLTPRTDSEFTVQVWLNGPWANSTWNGINMGSITVPAGSQQTPQQFQLDVSQYVDNLTEKNAIYLVVNGGSGSLCDILGLGFSKDDLEIERPVMPTLGIQVNGTPVTMPTGPIRSSDANGLLGYWRYAVSATRPSEDVNITATSSDPSVRILVTQPTDTSGLAGAGLVRFVKDGVTKLYRLFHTFGTEADVEVDQANVDAIMAADERIGGGQRLTVSGSGFETPEQKVELAKEKIAELIGSIQVDYDVTHISDDEFSLSFSKGATSMVVEPFYIDVEVLTETEEGYVGLETVMDNVVDVNASIPVTINAIHTSGERVNVTSNPNLSVVVRDPSIVSYSNGTITGLEIGKTFLDISYTDSQENTLKLTVAISVGTEILPTASAIYFNGDAIEDFSPSVMNYNKPLVGGPTDIVLTADLPGEGLSYTYKAPASLPGNATLTVTSVWGKSATYIIRCELPVPKLTSFNFNGETFDADSKTEFDVNIPTSMSNIDFSLSNLDYEYSDNIDASITFAPDNAAPCTATVTLAWKGYPNVATTYKVNFGHLTIGELDVKSDSDAYTASANVRFGDADTEYRIIFAIYEDGKMVHVSQTEIDAIAKHESGVISASIDRDLVKSFAEGATLKAFLWDKNYIPLTEAYEKVVNVDNISSSFVAGTIDEKWQVLNPGTDSNAYSVDKGLGLRLPTLTGDIDAGGTGWNNIFIREVEGNWSVTAKVFYPVSPTYGYQQIALLAWSDSSNFLKVELEATSTSGGNNKTIQFRRTQGGSASNMGSTVNANNFHDADGSLTLYYRITKTGNNTYTAYYSRDGLTFTQFGAANSTLNNVTHIGLFATKNRSASPQIDTYCEYIACTEQDGDVLQTNTEMRQNAVANVAKYVFDDIPTATSEDISFSRVPRGYTVTAVSSNPEVLSDDGTVLQANGETVDYTVTVADGDFTETKTISIKVG